MQKALPPLPLSARVVAAVCLAYGGYFTAISLMSLLTRQISIDFLAIGSLIAGVGLLRHNRASLVFLIWVCRLMLAATLCVAAVMLFRPGLITVTLGTTTLNAAADPTLAFGMSLGFGLVFGLIHWSLTRPKIGLAFPSKSDRSK
jgi:hypothetical protein